MTNRLEEKQNLLFDLSELNPEFNRKVTPQLNMRNRLQIIDT